MSHEPSIAEVVVSIEQFVKAYSNQEQVVRNATRLRAQLDSIASQTQRLAGQGNADARILVEELRKRRVTINANQASPAPGAAPR